MITNDEQLVEALVTSSSTSSPGRNIYVHEENEKGMDIEASEKASVASSGASSRDSRLSRTVKLLADFKCQFCGRDFEGTTQEVHGAHLYEFKSEKRNRKKGITYDRQLEIYNKLEFLSLNSPKNILCLCNTCNSHFDRKNIAIHPKEKTLMISNTIAMNKILQGGGKTYGELQETKITFVDTETWEIPEVLLQRRYRKFERKQKSPENYESSDDLNELLRIKGITEDQSSIQVVTKKRKNQKVNQEINQDENDDIAGS